MASIFLMFLLNHFLGMEEACREGSKLIVLLFDYPLVPKRFFHI